MREVREELGIILNQSKAKMIYHTRREETLDFYDVWLFHADANISKIKVQETEVVGVQWFNVKDDLLVLTRSQILDDLWGDSCPVIDRTVDTYIKNLRKKLRLDCIVTVKGIGYKYEVEQ